MKPLTLTEAIESGKSYRHPMWDNPTQKREPKEMWLVEVEESLGSTVEICHSKEQLSRYSDRLVLAITHLKEVME